MMDVRAAIVLTTVPDESEALEMARDLVESGLAGCVQRLPIMSTYHWQGRVDEGSEFLLLIKTTRDRTDAIDRRVHELSSYAVPEFLVLAVSSVSEAYLGWLENACREKSAGQ